MTITAMSTAHMVSLYLIVSSCTSEQQEMWESLS